APCENPAFTGSPQHGRRTHQPHRHHPERPVRPDRGLTEVSL
ncbi:MAG: hypothetical protein AVDCRST_MAG51-387, partial [uncultured Ramlibacter sp.]